MPDFAPQPGRPFNFGPATGPVAAGRPVLGQRPVANSRQPFVLGAAICYYLLVGGPVLLLQAAVNGTSFTSYGPFVLYVLALLAKDLMRLLPLIVFRDSRYGLLHPLILILSIWPIIAELPLLESNLQPLLGLLFGAPLAMPEFVGSEFRTESQVFFVLAELEILEALGLLTVVAVYSACARHFHAKAVEPAPAPVYAPERLKLLLLAAVIVSAVIVFAFVQSRGGVTAHLASLALGRARALQGAGAITVVAKLGLLAMVVWVCYSPATVRQPWFIAALLLTAATVFITAGSRGEFMLSIISAGLAWTIRTGRFPVKVAAISLPILLSLYGLLFLLRATTLADERSGGTLYDRLTNLEYADVYSAGSSEANLRVSVRGGPSVMLEGYNLTDGPLWGSSYAAMATWFIPRRVWPDKPRGVGSLYAQLFLGETREGTSIPIGVVAEAYWNFWIPGVFIVYALFGFTIFWAHHFFLRFGANPFVATAYVRFITDFAFTADHIVPYLHALTVLLLLWLVAKFLAEERNFAATTQPAR